MMNQLVLAAVMAVLLEASHWIRLRWDFRNDAFSRAWHLSVLLVSMAIVLILIDGGNLIVLVPRLLGWAPVLLFPVQFTQSYGLLDRMPLHTFSLFARRRWERNRQLGFTNRPTEIHFSHVYVDVAMVASVLTLEEKWGYIAGLVILSSWQLLALRGGRKVAILVGMILATLLAAGGEYGLQRLQKWVTEGRFGGGENSASNPFNTTLGKLGEVKQSAEILWRMKVLSGNTPLLLHTAIFNRFYKGRWDRRLKPETASTNDEFNYLGTREPVPGQIYYIAPGGAGEGAFAADLPRLTLRGSVSTGSLMPVPGNITSLTGFDVVSFDRNAMATILVRPKESVIDGVEIWDPHVTPDDPPWQEPSAKDHSFCPDLVVNGEDAAAVHAIAVQLGLKSLPLDQKLNAISQYFRNNYRYTRHPVAEHLLASKAPEKAPSDPLLDFLTTAHAGHCEYFATAAALMLRDAGVPARYAIGFAVMETDPLTRTSVIRGIHSHAWCRVWDQTASRWIDFDATPPDWLHIESPSMPWYQGALDWIQQAREDFFIWRNQPSNRLLGASIIGFIALLGTGVVARSLWRSRRHVSGEETSRRRRGDPAVRTPLHDLEPLARKLLGERPPGMTFSRWLIGLRAHLASSEGLDQAIHLHQSLRYDPAATDASATARLADLERRVRAEIAR